MPEEINMTKIVEKNVSASRKELSAKIHILAANLLEEDDRAVRGKLILKIMELAKEME